MRERAFVLERSSPLVGVVTEPSARLAGERPAVLVLNAGNVHRIGPGRLSVRMARRLAERGFLAVRFDHGGVGDSGVRRDRLTWLESTVAETREVMDAVRESHGADRFVLIGLCSGAVTAVQTALADARVVGVGALNSQAQDQGAEWNTYVRNRGWVRDYLTRSLRSPDSWKRALTGRVRYGRIATVLARSVAQRLFPPRKVAETTGRLARELCELADRGVRLLFVLSEGDHAVDYFDVVAEGAAGRLAASENLRLETVARSDHTFTLLANQREVLGIVEDWAAGTRWARAAEPAGSAPGGEVGGPRPR